MTVLRYLFLQCKAPGAVAVYLCVRRCLCSWLKVCPCKLWHRFVQILMIKFIVKMGGKVKGHGGVCFMLEREKIVRLWFNMWLTQQDLGIDSIFAEDVVYTES